MASTTKLSLDGYVRITGGTDFECAFVRTKLQSLLDSLIKRMMKCSLCLTDGVDIQCHEELSPME